MRIVSEKSKDVSRAEGKLAGAVAVFGVDFCGKTVLDIGSSTGGWTEYALRSGASRVVAVEKGTRQMKEPLRSDPRVELHEKTDIFEFVPTEVPDIILADVSFVSLTKVLMYARMELIGPQTVLLVMLKPQFEVGASYLSGVRRLRPGIRQIRSSSSLLNNGVVKNEKIRREILRKFEGWLRQNDFVILGKRDSELRGRYGNLERLYCLRLEKV